MGEQTEFNNNILKNASSYKEAENQLKGMNDSRYAIELAKIFDKNHLSGGDIAQKTHLSRSAVNNMKNPSTETKTPDRKNLINVCIAARATLEETNYILKLAGLGEIYSRDQQESLVYYYLAKGYSYEKIQMALYDAGFEGEDNLLYIEEK